MHRRDAPTLAHAKRYAAQIAERLCASFFLDTCTAPDDEYKACEYQYSEYDYEYKAFKAES